MVSGGFTLPTAARESLKPFQQLLGERVLLEADRPFIQRQQIIRQPTQLLMLFSTHGHSPY